MTLILYYLDKLSDFVASPFFWCSKQLQIVILSLISAVVLLAVFKKISKQEKVQYHKNKILGYILETGVFRDHIGRILANQARMLLHNVIYLRYVGLPFLVLMVPVMFVCIELDSRMGYEPLHTGDSFIIRARIDNAAEEKVSDSMDTICCETSAGIALETKPLRIVDEGQIFWRARIIDDSIRNYIRFTIPGVNNAVEKNVVTGSMPKQITPLKVKSNSWRYALYFAEPPIQKNSFLSEIDINYRRADVSLLSFETLPVIWFFILTIVFGLLVKPWLKVSF